MEEKIFEMTKEEVTARLAELEIEVRESQDVDFVEKATEEKRLLMERKAEHDEVDKRKEMAKDIEDGKVETKIVEERKEIKVMENKIIDIGTEEYRVAFLKNLQGAKLEEVEQRALTGGTTALPQQTANMIVDKLVDMVPLLNEIELFRVDGNVSFMVNTVAPGATLEAAGGAVTESAATLIEVSLGGYNMNAFLSIGADLASMAVSAFEDWLVRKLTEAIAYKVEYYIINGDGDSEPKGIENYVATWDVSDGTAVDWTGGDSNDALSVTDLDTAIGLLPAAYDKESKFLMSKKTFYTNVVNLTDVNNLPVVQREGGKFIVRGFEVVFSDQVAANDIFFGSFKRGMAGNLGVDIKVEKQRNLRYNSYDFLGWGVFDCKPAQSGCIVKIASDIQA